MTRASILLAFVLSTACFDGEVIGQGGGGIGGAVAAGGSGIGGNGGVPGVGGEGGGACCESRPCQVGVCEENVCSYSPRESGLDCVGEPGVCQGGVYAGECGQRLSQRVFPVSGAWTSKPVSDLFVGASAPPPRGVVSAEMTSDGQRLLVFLDDGLVYERNDGVWLAPKTFADMFPSPPPVGCELALAAPIAATIAGDIAVTSGADFFITTTDEIPSTGIGYNVVRSTGEATLAFCSSAPDETSVGGPPQDIVPAAYAFIDQRAPFGTTHDALTAFKVHAGLVYTQYSGMPSDVPACDLCYDADHPPEATSELAIDGQNGAPDVQSVVAAFHDSSTGILSAISD